MATVKILAFAGSTRKDSLNKKLVQLAAQHSRDAGAEVTLIDLRDLPMPLYDGDLEATGGIPENGKKFKNLLRDHAGLLISSPEYNSSISGVLKNAIDWASRPETDNETPLVCFKGKVVALMSASPGGLGGLRGLVHVRAILGNIGVIVLPDQLSISSANDAFDASGKLKDEGKTKQLKALASGLAQTLQKLNA
ncbi:MAG: NAD(P)H-dependent oxidoreductase [Verrucomicrobiota bacterium]